MKKIRFISGALVGALIQYLSDPERGRSRRARLKDQAAARATDLRQAAIRKARFQQGRLKGSIHEMKGGTSRSDEHPSDDLILQRIRSEVIGPSQAKGGTIEVQVNDGVVILKSPEVDGQLTDRIRQVAGVRDVVNG